MVFDGKVIRLLGDYSLVPDAVSSLSKKKNVEKPDYIDVDLLSIDVQSIDKRNKVQAMFLSQDSAPMLTEAETIKANSEDL